jgi:hypothetical protein
MSGPVGLAFALRYKYETDALGNGIDGIGQGTYGTAENTANNPASGRGSGSGSNADGKELGYQFLDTRFTGTSSDKLSV